MNSILVITYPLGIAIVLALVIGLGVFLTRKYHLGWRLFWIGGALLIISQILHIPFNIFVNWLFRSGTLPTPPGAYQLLFSAVFLGLSAGFFEELTRYAGLRWWAKDARSWSKGLLFGSGWGGFEAIIFFAAPLLINYVIFTMLRTMDLATIVPLEQLEPIENTLDIFWGMTWFDSMLGALERILTLPIQIALSLLVLQVFLRNQSRWLWFAILLHALTNGFVIIASRQWGPYAAEGTLAIFTLLSLGIIFSLRVEEPGEGGYAETNPSPPGFQLSALPPIEESEENIADSKYAD